MDNYPCPLVLKIKSKKYNFFKDLDLGEFVSSATTEENLLSCTESLNDELKNEVKNTGNQEEIDDISVDVPRAVGSGGGMEIVKEIISFIKRDDVEVTVKLIEILLTSGELVSHLKSVCENIKFKFEEKCKEKNTNFKWISSGDTAEIYACNDLFERKPQNKKEIVYEDSNKKIYIFRVHETVGRYNFYLYNLGDEWSLNKLDPLVFA